MSKILLSADSTCDISGELLERTKVQLFPLHIILGEKSYEDGVNITPDEIYANFRATGKLPKTAAINTQEYIDAFKPYIDQGYDVIHINLGSALSSSYQNCVEAARQIGHLYPINSCNLSSGSGHLVIEAAERIRQGMEVTAIVEELKNLVPKCHASFVIDKLDYLRAGGRCSALAMLGANLLQIKPSIYVNNADGSMTVGKKYRGKLEKVLVSYVHDKLSQYEHIRPQRIFITHAGIGQQYVDVVREEVEKLNFFQEIFIERASCTISSHCGPGTIGILFMTE
ncbi:MAG: DegV family protein [Acutalibacteraceae bacterium]|nr:DegV family protein [Clostridia bacterium]MEE3402922.1 DegV family protein [Acutalibacteraceae bacterium]HCA56282.1 DegV family protein [Oscillospiraceae bacterium]